MLLRIENENDHESIGFQTVDTYVKPISLADLVETLHDSRRTPHQTYPEATPAQFDELVIVGKHYFDYF